MMNRTEFLQSLGLLALTPAAMKLSSLKKVADKYGSSDKMPVLFVGHGNPMNAILDNSFTQGWTEITNDLPKPNAILCVSAHWETNGTFVTAMDRPKTIHDFYGFPQKLFDVQYPSPGAPAYAKEVQEVVETTEVKPDHEWGLDHGTWSVLVKMFPQADIPVFQLSLDYSKPAQFHYDLSQELASLRRKGVLIMGSGNIVHNLRMADLRNESNPYDWALEFDALSKNLIERREHKRLIEYQKLGKAAQLSIPTPEHYLPMLYAIALQEQGEEVTFFNEQMAFRSGSMRSFKIG